VPPHGPIAEGNAQIGGPKGIKVGFFVEGQGAPPAPPQHSFAFNDGPAPHHAPPNWEGPPPVHGWDGDPPPGGWNRPWNGPDRDVGFGQRYYAPFAFNDFQVIPTFNWFYGGWGYWYFGTWIPLY
jgi:hypothetical protein